MRSRQGIARCDPGLLLTVILGLSFTCVQAYEYAHAPFTFGFNHLRWCH